MNVVPNLVVGIGTTTPIAVNYNSEFEKLLINPVTFIASDVETNQIDIVDHGFKTGDKVFYDGSATGLSTGTYFVYRVNSSKFNLVETIIDLNSDPVVIGLEISDSEHLGIWEKERQENFGPSRMSGDTLFLKWFYGENFYLIAAREKRSVKLWTRTYNRTGAGRATFGSSRSARSFAPAPRRKVAALSCPSSMA